MFRDCLAFLSQADIIVLEPGSAATRPPGSGTRCPATCAAWAATSRLAGPGAPLALRAGNGAAAVLFLTSRTVK